MDRIKDLLVSILNDYPMISGLVMIILGVFWWIYRLEKKESFGMKDHGLASWGELVST
ncbi:MAG: hypothetical protein RIB79_04740 [Allomuricauda sp.]